MTERDALLVLNGVPNLGAANIRKLIGFFGSGLEVLGASFDEMVESKQVVFEHIQNIFNFSKDKFLSAEYNLMRQHGVVVITILDEEYPCSLKNIDHAPILLYVKGDVCCLQEASVAMVGSRASSFYGCKSAQIFAGAFIDAGMTVVSGLARGIDTAAHQGALDAGGKTIAVVGCGFSHVYPQENKALMEQIAKQGAIVSEFAFSMTPQKYNFPWRNRIISGLAQATVVIEAGVKSGALITADYATAQNKDVFVLPSNIDNETALGSNQLIRDGAMVALNPDDVLARIKPDFVPAISKRAKSMLYLTKDQEKIYPFITTQPVHIDELLKRSGIDISSLMNITLSLELRQVIRQLPGQYYVRNANGKNVSHR